MHRWPSPCAHTSILVPCPRHLNRLLCLSSTSAHTRASTSPPPHPVLDPARQTGYLFFNLDGKDYKRKTGRHYRGGFQWTVEILDLREAHKATVSLEAKPDASSLLQHLSGGPLGASGRLLPPSGQSAHAHGHGDRPSEKQDEAAAALAGGTATASGALTTSTACQPACFFRCCMACAASPVSLRACVDQIEVLNDERRLPSDLRLPQSNRTISPVTWCAAPHLPWPAPLWTHVGERRTCGVDIRAAVGHSPKLLDDIRKLTTLVQITQDHRRGLDGLQHYRSLRRNLGRSGKHSITNLTSHVNFTLASSPLQHSPSPSRIIAHRGDSALLAADATTPPTPPPCATYIDLRGSSFAPHTCSQFDADLARCSSARVGRTRCMLSNATSNATATATATAKGGWWLPRLKQRAEAKQRACQ